MPWFKVDEHLLTHPKFMGLSDGAVALWLRAGVWSASALTNGEVPHQALRMLAERGDDSAEELVERGLWERSKRGFRFHDWNDYQPTPEHVREVSNKRREAGRKGAHARNKQNAQQIAEQNSSNAPATGQQKVRPDTGTDTEDLSLAAERSEPDDPLRAALVEVCGIDPNEITKPMRGGLNTAVVQLHEIGATVAQVKLRARQYRRRWPDAAITPGAVVKHWAALGGSANGNGSPGAGYHQSATANLAAIDAQVAADRERNHA